MRKQSVWVSAIGMGLAFGTTASMVNCTTDETAPATSTAVATASGSGGAGGAGGSGGAGGMAPAPSAFCTERGLPVVAFDAKGPYGTLRHAKAADFAVPLVDGTKWRLSENWTGCDTYVVLGSARTNSALDKGSLWKRDIDQLVTKSPENAHYFFVATRAVADAQTELDEMKPRIEAALAKLEPAKAELWRSRLHLVAKHGSELEGWVKDVLSKGEGRGGFAIDRRQEVRDMGMFADVTRFKTALQNANEWPWESNLSYASYEVRHFNYEAKREAELAGDGATVVSVWKDEVLQFNVEKEIELPDAATLATFDTLTIDNVMDCSDKTKGEFGNCGAWDYIADLFLLGEDGTSKIELARFITTYHREGHYTVDATPLLVELKKGGKRKIRYEVSPEWNQQAYLSRVDFRFSNQKKGYRPTGATYLFSGGDFNAMYNAKYQPVEVDVPASAKRVELWAIITGHGGATQNCAEFCRHQHEFTVNGTAHTKDHPLAQKQTGCIDEVDHGMVPNQGGTWWFGRGGWCPGQQVKPYVVDVTADVKPGEKATVSYRGLLNGKEPPDNAGNIAMSSYLVVYE
jgi:hypothetical protein